MRYVGVSSLQCAVYRVLEYRVYKGQHAGVQRVHYNVQPPVPDNSCASEWKDKGACCLHLVLMRTIISTFAVFFISPLLADLASLSSCRLKEYEKILRDNTIRISTILILY
jgi:hypothetical protein